MSDKLKHLDRYVKKTYYRQVKFRLSTKALKQLQRIPKHIRIKFEYWCDLVVSIGLENSRKYKGFHDESLKGKRQGQRSVRLSKAYRVIYIEIELNKYQILEIIEVNKHEY